MAHEELEQRPLTGREIDATSRAPGDLGEQIQTEVADDKFGRGCLGRTSQCRADSCEELGEREGLGDVVVGPELEAAHLVRDVGAGGQDDHRERRVTLAKEAQHVVARRAWEAERSEEQTSELQSRQSLVCRLLLAKKK